jgi:cytochrome c-type biogenesis protein CcmH
MNDDIAALKHQLAQLEDLHRTGVLPDPAYLEGKGAIERRILDLVLAGDAGRDAPAPRARASRRPLAGIAVGVLAVAAAGYWWQGDPARWTGGTPAAGPEQNAPHGTDFDQIAAMTERLAARLQEDPKNAGGWAMLARSYSVLGRHAEAQQAYRKAIALTPDEADLLADFADSLAAGQGGRLDGEPMQWVQKALKLDAANPKALSLAATDAFARKDYAAAAKGWEQVVQSGPAGSDLVKQAQASLQEARELSGGGAAKGDKPAAMAAAAASVSGTVTLAPSLRAQASPGDTVFVFARAVGSRMPLAILRKEVRDLPLHFTLDDSLAMSPAAPLSGAGQVVVGARISKSGDATPQPGDLSGLSEPVAVGAGAVAVEIRERVAAK